MMRPVGQPLPQTREWTPNPPCEIPITGFKSWREDLVTQVEPGGNDYRYNCSLLMNGDRREAGKVRKMQSTWESSLTYKDLVWQTANCSWLVESFTDNLYNTQLEQAFPLAYAFIVYESPEQILRLLRLLYKPQNVYCIHVDKKSEKRDVFLNIARCFPNIFIPQSIIDVRWSEPSLLQAQMSCLNDLSEYRDRQEDWRKRWKYVVNLCGKELPLISTAEMVKKMKHMNGTSSVVAWPIPKNETWTMARLHGRVLPFNLTYYKSMTYNALSAQFVEFLLKNPSAKYMLRFFLRTSFAEEHYYATLFHMPGAPGGYNPEIPDGEYFEVGHYFWRTTQEEVRRPCFGKTIHGICVVEAADMVRILDETKNGSTALFQNKYFMEWDHVAMDCMEERIVGMNKREFHEECLGESGGLMELFNDKANLP